jgi:hypothetical protein
MTNTKKETNTDHVCIKATEIELIKKELENNNYKVDEIHKTIMGNGKKGILLELSEIKGALTFAKVALSLLFSLLSIIFFVILR